MDSSNKPNRILGLAAVAGILFVSGALIYTCYKKTRLENIQDYPEIPEDSYNKNNLRRITQIQPKYQVEYHNPDPISEPDYYQDMQDYYEDDPEDEITYPPEIFEAWAD